MAYYHISSGMFSSGVVLGNGDGMELNSGGSAGSTTVNFGGTMTVFNGGAATSTTVNAGGIMAVSGGSATSTTVNTGGGMTVFSGGTATSTTVKTGGVMTVSSGGTTGSIRLDRGAQVELASGARVEFELTGLQPDGNFLINNYTLVIDHGATYTITIGADQAAGTYLLVSNAATFTNSISLTVNGIDHGRLASGQSVTDRKTGVSYTLNNSGGNLTLTVGEPVPAEIFATGNAALRIDPDGTVTRHSASGATTLGTLDAAAWTLLDAAGDFDRDGADGVLWMENATGNVYMQNDLTTLDEVTGKKNLLGIVSDGYEVRAAGDFFGTGFDGALLLGPAYGDSSVSLNYGLATWTREQDGATTPGWLGALVNTWDETGGLNTLKGNYQNLTGDARNEVINTNNYRYEFVGVGDFNGDGKDDVMLRNSMPETVNGETITGAGDVFVFLTDTRENVIAGNRPADGIVYAGCATDGWTVAGIGDFNGDGIDDVLVSNGIDLAGWQLANGQRTADLWFGSLSDGWELAGVGDFDADGTDDILLCDANNNLAAWSVTDGKVTGVIAIA